jgi:hypothetical protein
MQGISQFQSYRRPIGYQQISAATLATSTHLTLPTQINGQPINLAVIQCNVAATSVRWRDDGTAPTATVGMVIGGTVSFELDYTGDLTIIQFIVAVGAPILDITYYAQ